MAKKPFKIRISKEDRRPKPRAGVKPTKLHRIKTNYSRKPKHPKKECSLPTSLPKLHS